MNLASIYVRVSDADSPVLQVKAPRGALLGTLWTTIERILFSGLSAG